MATGEIFLQAFTPRFGDGVDVLMGVGRPRIWDLAQKLGKNPEEAAATAKRKIYSSTTEVPDSDARPVVVAEKAIDLPQAATQAREASRARDFMAWPPVRRC